MPHALDRWMYEGGHPNHLARTLNGLWGRLAVAGIAPARLSALEVRGRKSGRAVSFPVVVADLEGERYLVAMLGEVSEWAKNVRAAGGEAVLIHGRREPIRLREVEADRRAPILRRYLQLAPGARPHFPIAPDDDLAAFEGIAADYPVFRVCDRAGDASMPLGEPAGPSYTRRDKPA